jgi:hypothetical protein
VKVKGAMRANTELAVMSSGTGIVAVVSRYVKSKGDLR